MPSDINAESDRLVITALVRPYCVRVKIERHASFDLIVSDPLASLYKPIVVREPLIICDFQNQVVLRQPHEQVVGKVLNRVPAVYAVSTETDNAIRIILGRDSDCSLTRDTDRYDPNRDKYGHTVYVRTNVRDFPIADPGIDGITVIQRITCYIDDCYRISMGFGQYTLKLFKSHECFNELFDYCCQSTDGTRSSHDLSLLLKLCFPNNLCLSRFTVSDDYTDTTTKAIRAYLSLPGEEHINNQAFIEIIQRPTSQGVTYDQMHSITGNTTVMFEDFIEILMKGENIHFDNLLVQTRVYRENRFNLCELVCYRSLNAIEQFYNWLASFAGGWL